MSENQQEGMSDGELIARSVLRVVRVLEVAHELDMAWNGDVDAELDRRAAQRMPVAPASSPNTSSTSP